MRIALPLILSCLLLQAQPEAKQRVKTVRELAKKNGAGAIDQLAGYLHDSDEEVRREAVKGIVAAGTQASLTPLIEASKDADEEIQIRSTDGLVNFYHPGYVERGLSGKLKRIGKGIESKFTDTNDLVIEPYITVREDVLKAVAGLIGTGSSSIAKANAARASGILRSRPAVPDLLAAVKSKDSQILYESLIALQKIREPESATGITFLLQDLNPKVQIAAIETVGLLQNKSALPSLKEALSRAKNNKIRASALASIAMLPDEWSRPLYDRYLGDRDENLRASAAEGYARLKNPADRERLQKAFDSEDKMKPRLSMAFATVDLGNREMAEFSPLTYLVNTLNSSSYHEVASAFLIELCRDKAVRESLYPNLPKRTKPEKIELASILYRSGDKDTLEPLEGLAHDPDVEVGQAAAKAARNLRARLP